MSMQSNEPQAENPFLVHLSSGHIDITKTGGKAARLMELHRLHLPVPDGFVLTVEAFHYYCQHNHIQIHDTHISGEEKARQIKAGHFPLDLYSLIEKALRFYRFNHYAVRSSSISEDGIEHSMAGQFETYLNVKSEDVFDQIQSCWASMFNPAVAAYMEKRNLGMHAPMGVIVQEQQYPRHAGVLFTMNPLTRDADHMVIEWVDGLGDRLVSGELTPERIIVSRMTQSVMYASGDESFAQSLSQLVQLAMQIERHYEYPVDIEWCEVENSIVILQVRPITGLKDEDDILWTNVNMVENFPSVVSPFTWSIVDIFYQYYTKHMLQLFGWKNSHLEKVRSIVNHTTGIHAGRIYYNLTNWYEGAHLLPIGSLLKRLLDNFIGQHTPFQYEPRSEFAIQANRKFKRLGQVSFVLRSIQLWVTGSKRVQQYEDEYYKSRAIWRSSGYEQQTLSQLLQTLDYILHSFVRKYYDRPALVDLFAAICPGGLNLLIKKWVKADHINTDLASVHVLQTDNLRSLEPTRLIEQQAKHISAVPHLQQLLDRQHYQELEQQLQGETLAAFQRFMDQFGGRCYHDCTMVSPTFEERHDLYWILVKKYQHLQHPVGQEGAADNIHDANYWIDQISHALPLWKRALFHRVLKQAHKSIRMREQSRLIRSLLFGEIRQVALQIGKHFVDNKHIEQPEDIFYLGWNEVEQLGYGKFQFPELIPQLIAMRKQAHENNEGVEPPGFFMRKQASYYQADEVKTDASFSSASQCIGVAVSGGKVKGRVRIIMDPVHDQRLQPGDILVTKSTDPGWTPLFKIAGGIVLEKGGMLSHGAIVAREFGIPAVAAVERATSLLIDGEMIIVNGHTGEIERLEAVEAKTG